MGISCPNRNSPEYKQINAKYKSDLTTTMLIAAWQQMNNSSELPTLSVLESDFKDAEDLYNIESKGFSKDVINNLAKLDLIKRDGNNYVVVGDQAENIEKIKAYLAFQNISPSVAIFEDGKFFLNKAFYNIETVSKKSRPNKDATHVKSIVEHMNRIFPNVDIEMATLEQAKKYYDSLPNSVKSKVNFSEINSFYFNGKAYLIEERITNDIAAEEVLHPFVYAISKENPALFEDLLLEAKANFGDLFEDITNTYTNARGFTQTDRDLELVTQALSIAFTKEFDIEAGANFKTPLERFLQFFFDLVNKLYSYLSGKELNQPNITIDEGMIAPGAFGNEEVVVGKLVYARSISDIAKMLNRKDLKFVSNSLSSDKKVRYSFSPEKKETYDYIKNMGNALQRNLMEKIFFKPLSSKDKIDELTVSLDDDGAAMVMRDKNHVYKDLLTGDIYESTTKVISGTPKQMEAYEINRDIGNDFDLIADMIAGGKIRSMSDIESIQDQFKVLNLEQSKDALEGLITMTKDLMDDGSILIPQVIVHDQSTKIAGTIDLLAITPEGKVKIIDLKTSIHSKDGNVYNFAKLNLQEDSLVKKNVTDPSGKRIEKLTRKQKQNLQVNLYKRMLENMGVPVDYSDNAAITFHIKVDMDGKGSNQKYKGTFKLEGTTTHLYKENAYIVDQLMPLNIDALSQETIEEIYGESEDAILEEIETLDGTAVEDDVIDEDVSLEGTQAPEEYVIEDLAPEFDMVTRALKSYQMGLVTKLEALEKVRSNIFMDKDEELLKAGIVNDITEISIALSDTPEERSRLLTELMRGALAQVKNFEKYVKDPKNFGKTEFITYVMNFDRFLSTFKGLFELQKEGNLNNTQKNLAFTLQTKVLNLVGTKTEQGIIDNAIVDYVRDVVRTKSSRNFTEVELDMLMKQANDIGALERSGQDLATSSDTLLALMDKIFKAKKMEMLEKTALQEIRIKDVASRLIKLSESNDVNEIYDFMLEFDSEGNFTGRYTTMIGPVYYDKLLELRSKLFDADGRPYQYRDIVDLDEARKTKQGREDIAYNIELATNKKNFSDFFAATTIGANDQPVDGKYHKYNDTFKKARAKHEVFIPVGTNGYWEKRADVSDKDYRLYKLKYFEKSGDGNNVYAEQIDGKYTGKIVKDNVFFYVKPKYREIRTDVMIDGKSVINPKYKAIMENDTALGKVQREFFTMWNELYENDLLNRIPRAQRDQMMGQAPLVRGRMTKALRGKDPLFVSMFGKMAQNTKNFWTKTSEQRVMIADERGQLVDHFPIFFTGRPKTQAQLDAIDDEITALKDRAQLDRDDPNWLSVDKYNEEVALLKGKRMRIEARPFKNEISRDLATSLLKFMGTVNYFDTMSGVEDTMKAMYKVIGDRTYQPSKGKQLVTGVYNKAAAAAGKDAFTPVGKAGLESNVRYRASKWLSMVFYNSDEVQKSVVDKLAQSIMNLSSYAYVGLNPFGNINNYVFGRVTDTMEAFGGRFYTKAALARASVEYNKRLMPSAVQRIAGGATKLGATQAYDPDKANNKYEALVDLFRMMDEYGDIREITDDKTSYFKGKFQIAFFLQDAAEFNVQTKVGIAMLIDTQIRKSSDGPGGKSISLYDAFEYDKETHSVKLKEGYDTIVEYNDKILDENGEPSVYYEREYNDDWRYEMRNKIREVNKQLHGNYAADDRMVIQNHVIGKLFAQFHKWVIPAFNARFRLEYYDENLGWMEGRYLSFWRLVSYYSKMAVNFNFSKMNSKDFMRQYSEYTDGKDMQSDQKIENYVANGYRVLGEASMIFLHYVMSLLFKAMFADDDDASELETRAENLLMYQTDRTWKELITFVPVFGFQQQYQMIKSPIASSRTMGELGQALAKSIETPIALMTGSDETDSNIYYQRGSRAGQLKLTKEWMDAIPVLYAIKKYQNLIEQQDFYVK